MQGEEGVRDKRDGRLARENLPHPRPAERLMGPLVPDRLGRDQRGRRFSIDK